ncbi:MAG: GTP 3',8-cyclase MoaA [Actinomycetaceae bacterium]|nr:GTP 3',8-cyclase MoaA [Arcanobacterium sp.]MDD7687032.1 GTP 3',8-cyclase MoaA [Actinomycetaceae bacterium]MDY5273311.1 GTP 3',8-cyclase MoaA [Arcanobacterium sp.]
MARLVDRFGRVARDMRVSLTDRCNLRCSYCMPENGVSFMPARHLLTDNEVIRLVRIGVEKLGISTVRFTGGEPLLRSGLEEIIAATSEMTVGGESDGHSGERRHDGHSDASDGCSGASSPIAGVDDTPASPDIALTTNGIGLDKRVRALKNAGLRRVNISLDSIHEDEYVHIARRQHFAEAVAGIKAARRAGLDPVKINAVLMRGVNDRSAADLVAFGLSEGVTVRFIEYMPLGPRDGWRRDAVVRGDELIARLREDFDVTPISAAERGSAPAQLWNVAAGWYQGVFHPAGMVGFISSVSDPFCGQCDRTRLTADGSIRSCLFSDSETNLRELLRSGASDEDIMRAWQTRMWAKPKSHGMDDPDFVPPERTMSSIGG